MDYEKQNFQSGNILTAQEMDNIDKAILDLMDYHNEGILTTDHSESVTTSGRYAAAGGGNNTNASGDYSFSFGENVQAIQSHQVVFGKYNDSKNEHILFAIGNGEDNENRKNAFAVTDETIYINGKTLSEYIKNNIIDIDENGNIVVEFDYFDAEDAADESQDYVTIDNAALTPAACNYIINNNINDKIENEIAAAISNADLVTGDDIADFIDSEDAINAVAEHEFLELKTAELKATTINGEYPATQEWVTQELDNYVSKNDPDFTPIEITIEQEYKEESQDALSGKAVKQALDTKPGVFKNGVIGFGDIPNTITQDNKFFIIGNSTSDGSGETTYFSLFEIDSTGNIKINGDTIISNEILSFNSLDGRPVVLKNIATSSEEVSSAVNVGYLQSYITTETEKKMDYFGQVTRSSSNMSETADYEIRYPRSLIFTSPLQEEAANIITSKIEVDDLTEEASGKQVPNKNYIDEKIGNIESVLAQLVTLEEAVAQ